MASKRTGRAFLTAAQRLLAADTTRDIIATPGATFRLRIFRIVASVVTSAAQQIDVGVSGGGVTQQIISIPASSAGVISFESDEGFLMPANKALVAKPAAAGPAIQFFVEYTIEPA